MLRLLILAVLLFSTAPAWAAATFDVAFEKKLFTTTTNTFSFVSNAGDVTGTVGSSSDRVLICSMTFNDPAATIGTVGMTWNSVQTMTPIQNTNVGGRSIYQFGLIGPASGANTIAVTWTNSVSTSGYLGCVAASGVAQTSSWIATGITTGTSTTADSTVTTVAGNLAVVMHADNNASTIALTAGGSYVGTSDYIGNQTSPNAGGAHFADNSTTALIGWTLGTSVAWANLKLDLVAKTAGLVTNYYVATAANGGSDSNDGSSGTPFLTIQKCANVAAPGNVCNVGDGTFTVTTAGTNATVGSIDTAQANGTAALPITMRSTNPLGAKIIVPSSGTSRNAGFLLTRQYWIIERFEIYGGTNATAAHHGIFGFGTPTGTIIRNNVFHDIGRVCTSTVFGMTGIYMPGGTGVNIYNNVFHDIGRYFGTGSAGGAEAGCTIANYPGMHNHDHGVYLDGNTTGTLIHNNIFYSMFHGWGVQLKGTQTGAKVYNNTFSGTGPDVIFPGHIVFDSGTYTTVDIANNLSLSPTGTTPGFILYSSTSSTFSGVTIRNNIIYQGVLTGLGSNSQPAGVTASGNKPSTNPNVTNAATKDFTLTASSTEAIDAGVAISGLAFNGSGVDIGAFESWKCNSFADVTANLMNTTCAMNLNTPILPATGITGAVAKVGGVARTTTSAIKLSGSDSIVSTTFNGAACANGETWTFDYTPGNLTDSALIGSTLNQPALASTALAVSNSCAAPATTGTLSQATHQFTQSQTPGTALSAVGASNTNIRRGTSFALVTQTDCTVHACDPTAERLFYRKNAGAYAAVPDVMGADQISFLGVTGDPSYLSGTITCCLSGALTANSGDTQFTSAATPVFTLAQNASVVQRRQLLVGPSAVLSDTYEFLEYTQSGVVLPGGSTPAAGAKITITPADTIAAPASLTAVGASSNTLIDLVWAPVTDVALAGYHVYASLTSGVYTTPILTITAASAAAAHTTMTQYRTVASSAGTYYFTVKAFDTGGQESPASNEVAVVRTGFTAPAVRVP